MIILYKIFLNNYKKIIFITIINQFQTDKINIKFKINKICIIIIIITIKINNKINSQWLKIQLHK